MGGKSSSSSSQNTTNQYDQRSITTVDDRDTSTSYDLSNKSTNSYDLSNRSSNSYDSSNRSTTTTNTTINASDPGAVRLGEINAQLLGQLSANGSDALRVAAGLGQAGLSDLTGALGNISGASERAWSHTIDKAGSLLESTIAASKASTDAAKSLAASAISSYQPADSKLGDTFKYSAIAAAAIVALMVFKKA